jgi:pimeloyl-ACP methyl ester carboxylesterase
MSLEVKRGAGAVARLSRRAIPARGWRRYVTGGVVVALGAFGAVTAIGTQPAQAAHHTVKAQTMANTCTPAPSPTLAGFTQGMVSIPGDKIHYVIGGQGPALVLIHGWPMTWWEWHTVMPSLSKTHTVIAFDLPGLGNSTVPTTGGYTAADTAVRLHEALAGLGYTGSVAILAHDLGTNVAYAYARLYSKQVSRMMVLESLLNGYGLESIYGFSFHFGLNMSPAPIPEDIINDHEAEVAYLNQLYSYANKPGAITTQDEDIWYAAYNCAANREAGYNYYRAFPENETWNLATNKTKLTMPIAAMGGQDSFGTAVATSFENVDTHVSTIVAPDAGHYIPEEDPAFLTECATLFFNSNPEVAPPGYASCLP